MQWVDDQGLNAMVLWDEICDVIVKTILAIHPRLVRGYQSYFGQRSNKFGSACFEVLGFDIMLDSKVRHTAIMKCPFYPLIS